MDRRSRAGIDAPGRLGGDQHAWRLQDLPPDDELLQVAAGQAGGGRLDAARDHAEALDDRVGVAARGTAADEGGGDQTHASVAAEQGILDQGHVGDGAVPVALLRHAGEAEIAPRLRVQTPDLAAVDADRRRPRRRALAEERVGHGAVADMTLVENALLSGYRRMDLVAAGFIRGGAASRYAAAIVGRFRVVANGVEAAASSLSGGNLQKFVVGREILQAPGVLVAAQPTWGVDAGAAAAIHQALIDLAANGTAVLVISQDLDELLTLTDRLAVINEGVLSAPLVTHQASIEQIGLLMGGLHGLEQERPPARASAVHVA